MSEPDPPFPDHPHPSNGTNPTAASTSPIHPTTAAKRQRRPSVRLGYVGSHPAASDPNLHRPKLVRLPNHKLPKHPSNTNKSQEQEFDYYYNWNSNYNNNNDYDDDANEENQEENGILSWLNRLGLGRYAQVFEVHEVDEEVLPWLTLEDLKDMGVNAVGARRKMFCAIQKLRRAKHNF